MQNAGLDESQAGIKTARRNIYNLRYADDTTLMAEGEEELKSLLKEESEKAGLKKIWKTKIMASSPITSWQIEGKKWKQWQIFFFLGSKITVDGDCSHKIKRHLLLGRKAMTNLDSIYIKKQRHHFTNKDVYSQSYGFSNSHVWMWNLDHKEDWCWRTDAFELWCWRRLLRVPWTARILNQSILKEINPK